MTEQVLASIITVAVAVVPVILYFGKSKQQIIHLEERITESETDLKESVKELKESIKDLKSAIDKFVENDKNVALVAQRISFLETTTQNRLITLERDVERCRVHIHRLANEVQVKLYKREADANS